jgi:LmbE family N-acetylglucosaminyl deacetylase
MDREIDRRARKVVLAIFAHPDDAEILCAGTLFRLADLGWETHIVTATPGDCGSATLPPEQIAHIRRAEAATAAHYLGATYHCLEERDVNVFFRSASNRKVIDLFRAVCPTMVLTHPRHDYMLDHEQVHLLARSASFSYSIPNASALPLKPGSSVPWLYYCDPIEGRDPYDGRRVTPSTLIDITAVMPRKIEMLACHVSQREWLRSHHGMDEYIESMKQHNSTRGREIGVQYAEAFVQHRGHAYPESDNLAETLGGRTTYDASTQ